MRLVDIMTPRTVLFALPETLTVKETLSLHPRIPFSRLPVHGRDLDDITGFVLRTDLLLAMAEGKGESPLKILILEIAAAPGQTSLRDAFDLLLQRRQHILLVLDEYGGTAGIATLEDVVETLLGLEIVDEADTSVDMQELARRHWRRRAKLLGIVPDTTAEAEGKDKET